MEKDPGHIVTLKYQDFTVPFVFFLEGDALDLESRGRTFLLRGHLPIQDKTHASLSFHS